MVRSKDTYLSKFYWKLKVRSSSKKAIIAVARKMLVIIYFMLKNNVPYSEEHFEDAKQKYEESRKKKLFAEANKLGFYLTPLGATAQ